MTQTKVSGRICPGVTNVGCKPTVNNSNKVVVETHLLDFEGDLYGIKPEVSFIHYIRPERKFDSLDALQEQMKKDIETCRTHIYYKNVTNMC